MPVHGNRVDGDRKTCCRRETSKMNFRRKASASSVLVKNAPMNHESFIDRIRKSLYFGENTVDTEMEVSRPLAEYASELFSEPHKGHSLNRLSTIAAGSVHATPCSLIMALIYLDRLNVVDPGYARLITPQELFIVSMMISTKFYSGHDEEIYLSDWAEDGDMDEERLKELEIEFLCAIEWNIYISNEQFFNKLQSIERILAKREGLRRGWLTYTELTQLLPSFALAKFILNHVALLAISYAASVMTIASAFLLVSQIPVGAMLRRPTSTPTNNTATGVQPAADTILPSDPIDATTMAVNATGTDVDSVTLAANARNASCTAFNVEEELVKLERQYREEAERDDRRSHRNEITSESRLTLPEGVTALSDHSTASKHDTTHNAQTMQSFWLALKEEFKELMAMPQPQLHHHTTNGKALYSYQTDWNGTTNTDYRCRSNLPTADRSFLQIPIMWFKYI